MNLFDVVQSLIERTSQMTAHQWLLTSACVILGCYALLVSRRP
jgi:hypothetical protein